MALTALACNAAAQQVDIATPTRQSAAVIVANRTIIMLRGPIAGYSARERVTNVSRRIDEVLDSDPSPTVSTEEVEGGTQVLLGGKLAFVVTGIDIDQEIGETPR